MTKAYLAGFSKEAESFGVNPGILLKASGMDKKAFWPLLLGGLAGLAGTFGYGLYKTRHPKQSEIAPLARKDYFIKHAPPPTSAGNIKGINDIKNKATLQAGGNVF